MLDSRTIKSDKEKQAISKDFLLENDRDKITRLIDSKAAKAVAKHLKDKLAYCSKSKSWLIWKNNHWNVTQDTDYATSLIAKIVDKGCGSHGYQQRYLNAIVRQMRLTGVLQREPSPATVVPFSNGLLNIESGELSQATPNYSTDWVLPHAYDEKAECDNIKAWLFDAVTKDKETFNLLRAWIAALVRGIPLQKILMLIGRGGSGKGVFQRLVIETIGEANSATSTLTSLEGNRFETAKHFGKSLCLINEAGRFGGQLSMLKAMSGGDYLPLERKHQQQSGSFKYKGLILLATNDDIASSDSGIERRRVAVRFSKHVTKEERREWQDRGGEEALLHAEIPGLIRWALQLPVREIHDAFENLPKRIVEENLLGMRSGSSVADWLISDCFLDPEVHNQMGLHEAGATKSDHLYPAYRIWCEQSGRKPLASNRFKSELFEVALTLDHQLVETKNEFRQVLIYGICLNSVKSLFANVPTVPSLPTKKKTIEGTEGTFHNKGSTEHAEWLAAYDHSGDIQ